MKVKRIICPQCNKETKIVLDHNDPNNYQEEVVEGRCETCPKGPADRLLDAIFGKKEE